MGNTHSWCEADERTTHTHTVQEFQKTAECPSKHLNRGGRVFTENHNGVMKQSIKSPNDGQNICNSSHSHGSEPDDSAGFPLPR